MGSKVCMNGLCGATFGDGKRGWPLRSGGFAVLCHSCWWSFFFFFTLLFIIFVQLYMCFLCFLLFHLHVLITNI